MYPSPPNATLHGFMGDVSVTSNRACNHMQLALGTAVIGVAAASR